ncbi:MAG TPA: nucleoside hydrolase [Bacteroidales bacterium]|nr:nucleoside hydrolase [Bacteroidales bacterium]
MKRIIILLLLIISSSAVFSHPWKPKHYVIIDTDAGIDDIKAISMLLASPDVRVLAISISPGVLNSQAGYVKIKSLLNSYYHEGIPVGINRSCSFKSPDFSNALSAEWGEEVIVTPVDAPESIEMLREIFSIEKNKVTMICLGGLSTAASALKQIPQCSQGIKQIIWSADGLTDKKGFNYSIDPKAAASIIGSGIPVTVVKSTVKMQFYDPALISKISEINNVYSGMISTFLKSEESRNHDFSFNLADDAVPVFLHYPELFSADTTEKGIEAVPFNISQIKEKTIKIFRGETVERNQVIKEFPATPSFYFKDIESSVSEIINRYGPDEWASGVIANELHRHLGVFAIIGVKMGIRAREYFDTGVDEFMATSYAGSLPPLSCMNDGLQVSTGATPGHGLLTVKTDSLAPSAIFSYMNSKIKLTLKPEIASMISSELKEINFVYGLDSDIYWELVRKNSIKYWFKLDRHDIFIIERLY